MPHAGWWGNSAPHSHIETQDNGGSISKYTSQQWQGVIPCASWEGNVVHCVWTLKLLPKCHTATTNTTGGREV